MRKKKRRKKQLRITVVVEVRRGKDLCPCNEKAGACWLCYKHTDRHNRAKHQCSFLVPYNWTHKTSSLFVPFDNNSQAPYVWLSIRALGTYSVRVHWKREPSYVRVLVYVHTWTRGVIKHHLCHTVQPFVQDIIQLGLAISQPLSCFLTGCVQTLYIQV